MRLYELQSCSRCCDFFENSVRIPAGEDDRIKEISSLIYRKQYRELSSRLPLKLGNSQLHLKVGDSSFLIRPLISAMSILELNKIPGMHGITHQFHLPKSPHM